MNKPTRITIVIGLLFAGLLTGLYLALDSRPPSDDAVSSLIHIILGGIAGVYVSAVLGGIFWLITNLTLDKSNKILFSFVGLTLLLGPVYLLSRKPVTCAQIQEIKLRTLLASQQVSTADLHSGKYDAFIRDAGITIKLYEDEHKAQWTGPNQLEYTGYFQQGILKKVEVSWGWNSKGQSPLEPSADEVISCFGPPDFYRIGNYGFYQGLSLWYLDEGLVIYSSPLEYDFHNRLKVSRNVIMNNMVIVAPDTLEEMVASVEYEAPWEANVMKELRTWPGTWNAIINPEGF